MGDFGIQYRSLITMACFGKILNDDNPEYTSLSFQRRVTSLNISKILPLIPQNLSKDTSIEVIVYSNENVTLKSCEKELIGTGIVIEPFLPITHNIRFEGVTNQCGIETFSRYIFPVGEEIRVLATNFDVERRLIPKGMPLGKIIVSSN